MLHETGPLRPQTPPHRHDLSSPADVSTAPVLPRRHTRPGPAAFLTASALSVVSVPALAVEPAAPLGPVPSADTGAAPARFGGAAQSWHVDARVGGVVAPSARAALLGVELRHDLDSHFALALTVARTAELLDMETQCYHEGQCFHPTLHVLPSLEFHPLHATLVDPWIGAGGGIAYTSSSLSPFHPVSHWAGEVVPGAGVDFHFGVFEAGVYAMGLVSGGATPMSTGVGVRTGVRL